MEDCSLSKECSHAKRKKIVLFGLKSWFEQKLSTAAVLQKRLSGLAGGFSIGEIAMQFACVGKSVRGGRKRK